VFRILSALFLALGCHLLLFLLPLPQSTLQPQLPGKKGIEVQLHAQENTPPAPAAPLRADTVAPVPRAPVIVAPVPEPVSETIVPKTTAVIRIKEKTPKTQYPLITPPSAPPQKKKILQDIRPQQKLSRPAIVEAAPLYRQNPKPEYPSLARRRNWQGTVLLSVIVSVEGKGKSIRIHRSSGHTILDKSALQTVNSWYFRPGTKGNIPVEMEILVPVHFKLDD